MILVITRAGDAHGSHMVSCLREYGATVVVVDYSQFPVNASLSLGVDNSHFHLPGERAFSIKKVTSILNRREGTPQAPEGVTPAIGEYIVRETQHFLDCFPDLAPCAWVSHPDAIAVAGRKPYQLQRAKELGLRIPKTLVTNSPEDATVFVESLNSPVAVKTLWTPGISLPTQQGKQQYALYTRKLSASEVLRSIARVQNCPMIFQEYIEKAFELRITVVGRQTFSCAIHSQESPHTREDWRRYDLDHTPHTPFTLPQAVEAACVALVEGYGLKFGCIDMIMTPDQEFVFLELNPSGQWLWIEQLTGLPISAALTQLLCNPEIGQTA